MKDVVSFETAKRLKDAGFPQPEKFTQWQAFYKFSGDVRRAFITEPRMETETLAPSSTDILKELGYDFALKFFDDSKKFCCWQDNQDGSWQTWTDQNPAEACALAWLSIYEKTTNQ